MKYILDSDYHFLVCILLHSHSLFEKKWSLYLNQNCTLLSFKELKCFSRFIATAWITRYISHCLYLGGPLSPLSWIFWYFKDDPNEILITLHLVFCFRHYLWTTKWWGFNSFLWLLPCIYMTLLPSQCEYCIKLGR